MVDNVPFYQQFDAYYEELLGVFDPSAKPVCRS
jgi:hypothetical protein